MTYTIYPCTDDQWIKLFRKIKKIAKQTDMMISSIDIIEGRRFFYNQFTYGRIEGKDEVTVITLTEQLPLFRKGIF